MSSSGDLAAYVAHEHFAWPGGYEIFAVTDDSAVLCYKCCATELPIIALSNPGDGWHVIGYDCAANVDGAEQCDHCYRWIVPEEAL